MKKIVTVTMMLAVMFAYSFSANLLEGGKTTFTNITLATQKDTLRNNDTMACVIDQISKSGTLADKVCIFLPKILAASDSSLVVIQELPSADAGKNYETRNSLNKGSVDDAVEAPNSDGATWEGKSHVSAYYSYTLQPKTISWSPDDSLVCPRARVLLIGIGGNPIITGVDSLGTSPVYFQRLFAPKD